MIGFHSDDFDAFRKYEVIGLFSTDKTQLINRGNVQQILVIGKYLYMGS